jgi:serine/threonine protein kinase
MTFDPKPGQHISINGTKVEFTSVGAPGHGAEFIYAEVGREATVYMVRKAGMPHALKVFHPNYQDKRLLGNSQKINLFSNLDGLRVAGREIITRQTNSQLINTYPELEFAVLMPWVKGNVWSNVIANKNLIDKEKLIQLAKSFTNIVCGLESRGLAHCDLSNNNFIFDWRTFSIELIDIEAMFAPDMPRPVPEPSFGTPGYRTSWIAENGLWGPCSDRFASAILCAEILTWGFSEIRENIGSDDSFFNENDFGEENKRYVLMKNYLGQLDPALIGLFERAWFAKRLEDCPAVCEWKNILNLMETKSIDYEGLLPEKKNSIEPTINISENCGFDLNDSLLVMSGVPARMEISHFMLNFGIVNTPKTSASFKISNPGGAMLIGTITAENWLEVSLSNFEIAPSTQCEIHVDLKSALPTPQSKYEYRSASAIIIESNTGIEVIGAMYTLPKKSIFN